MQEWFERAERLNEMTQGVNKLVQHLTACNNRELLYDLYAYVWDIRGVISLLNSYVKWLGEFEMRNMLKKKCKFKIIESFAA